MGLVSVSPPDHPAVSKVDLVIGWFPHWAPDGSDLSDADITLRRRLPSLLPATLYGDKVTVICPESDDFYEMHDFSDFRNAVGPPGVADAADDAFELLSLEGGYPAASGADEGLEPLDLEVWLGHAERYVEDTRTALRAGDESKALDSLARFIGISWGMHDYGGVDVARKQVPEASDDLIAAAEDHFPQVMDEVIPTLLWDTFCSFVDAPGAYPVIDDRGGVLRTLRDAPAGSGFEHWARIRGAEATLATSVLREIPSPRPEKPWAEAVEVRDRLAGPLARFRSAMAAMAVDAPDPFSPEQFAEFTTHVWRTRIDPALDELEGLVREASLREVFFRDVLGDLSTYAGPALGLTSAVTDSLPALVSAAVAALPPVAKSLQNVRDRRQAFTSHDFLFLYDVRPDTRPNCR